MMATGPMGVLARRYIEPGLTWCSEAELANLISRQGYKRWGEADTNWDAQKRNILIRVLFDLPIAEIWERGLAQLRCWEERHGRLAKAHLEWRGILERRDPEELARIVFSLDDEPTRQRISSPLYLAIPPEVVLEVKRGRKPFPKPSESVSTLTLDQASWLGWDGRVS